MNLLPIGRKPRGDSRLKTLPGERQTEIAAFLQDHSLAETVQWLGADGFKTNVSSLSVFLSWHQEQIQLRQDAKDEARLEQRKFTEAAERKIAAKETASGRKRGNGALGVSYRQPNSNSVLKTLPEERQAEIASFRGSLASTVQWLADHGVVTNIASLSDFLAWRRAQTASRFNRQQVAEIIAEQRAKNPAVSRDELARVAANAFGVLALQQKDAPGFLKRHERAAELLRTEVPA